jgi:ATP-dependent helicase HrpA
LQRKLAAQATGTFAAIYDRSFNRDNVGTWDFGDLPESITVQRFEMSILAFPALVDQGGQCALRLFPSRAQAEAAHRAGVRRLFRIECRGDFKNLANNFPRFDRMSLHYYSLGKSEELREDLVALVADRALFSDDPVPSTKLSYESLRDKAAMRLQEVADRVAALVADVLEQYHNLTLLLDPSPPPAPSARKAASPVGTAVSSIRGQLSALLSRHFPMDTPYVWLENFPRYISGMRLRLEKLNAGGKETIDRDLAAQAAITPWQNKYLERLRRNDALAIHDPELEVLRWMLEEYRISVFAQELGTAMPVSERRLEKQWEKTRR